MHAAEHAPRDPSRALERRHGLALIVERGSVVHVPANNYANTLLTLERFKEAKSMLLKTMPVA